MANNTEHNAAVCERYLRFVIEIEYTGNYYYTIWGTDHTSPEEEDKMLVDEEGHFLLFKTIDAALDYVRGQKDLFDRERFDGWLKEIKLPLTPHMGIDLDLLQDEEIDISTEESFEELINTQNFVSDYAHQSGDEYLMDLFYEHPLETLFDLYIDTYLEEGTEAPPIPKGLEEDAVPKLNEVYDLIAKKIKIM